MGGQREKKSTTSLNNCLAGVNSQKCGMEIESFKEENKRGAEIFPTTFVCFTSPQV